MARTRCLITSYFLKAEDEADRRLREAGIETEFQPRHGARDEDEVIRIAQGFDAVCRGARRHVRVPGGTAPRKRSRHAACLPGRAEPEAPQCGAARPHEAHSHVINTARGGLIDHDALYEALKGKKIAGAALDAFEQEPLGETPLRALDNCWLSPHAAGSSRDARARSKHAAVENVLRFFRAERPLHVVNPEVLKK